MAGTWASAASALQPVNFAPLWKPQTPGESVAGRVTRIDRCAGQDGKSTVFEVEQQDGKRLAFWATTSILASAEREHVVLGDIVGVKYFGEKIAEKSGRTYKAFVLSVLERGHADAPF